MQKILLLGAFILVMYQFEAMAQEWNPYADLSPDSLENLSRPKVNRFLEIGASANAYNGDLGSYEKWSGAIEIAYKLNKSHRFNGRIALSLGFITGENLFYEYDATEAKPNTFFRSNMLTLHYELHYNLLKTRRFLLYLSQGVGLTRFVTQDQEGESLLEQNQTRPPDETYGNTALLLPTGLGAAYILKNGYGIGIQVNLLNTQSDFLDNIAQWGNKSGGDNVLRVKLMTMIPIDIRSPRRFPPRLQRIYAR